MDSCNPNWSLPRRCVIMDKRLEGHLGHSVATAEQIKALICSHFRDEGERFVTTALQLAAHEANQGHIALARDIRSLVDKAKSDHVRVVSISHELDDLVLAIKPFTRLAQLVVPPALKKKIERILNEYHKRDRLARHGMSNRRKILLAGPPGTGKTMTANVLAAELKLPFFSIQMDKLVTKYMGETGAKLRQIFALIRERRGVYLFDEFDAIGAQRGMDNEVGEMRRVLNAWLQFIEADESDSLIVAATNNLGLLDQALFRRFEDVLHYQQPDKTEIACLVENRLGTFRSRFIVANLAPKAIGLSHAEITQACDDAIKDSILDGKQKVTGKQLLEMLADRKAAYGAKPT